MERYHASLKNHNQGTISLKGDDVIASILLPQRKVSIRAFPSSASKDDLIRITAREGKDLPISITIKSSDLVAFLRTIKPIAREGLSTNG